MRESGYIDENPVPGKTGHKISWVKIYAHIFWCGYLQMMRYASI